MKNPQWSRKIENGGNTYKSRPLAAKENNGLRVGYRNVNEIANNDNKYVILWYKTRMRVYSNDHNEQWVLQTWRKYKPQYIKYVV